MSAISSIVFLEGEAEFQYCCIRMALGWHKSGVKTSQRFGNAVTAASPCGLPSKEPCLIYATRPEDHNFECYEAHNDILMGRVF
jgi:hypothetical protein